MDLIRSYRCPECSTRTYAVMIPEMERQEHEAWHREQEQQENLEQ